MSTESTPASTDERIMEAASMLFHENGYHATTLREVAAAAGITAGSVYNHYRNKQDLLFRIANDTMRDMLAAASAALADISDPADRLRAFVRCHIVFCVDRRFEARVADDELRALEPANREKVIAVRDEYEAILKSILLEGAASSGWNVWDVPVVTFAIATMASAVSAWFHEDGRLSKYEVADIYTNLLLAAFGEKNTDAT